MYKNTFLAFTITAVVISAFFFACGIENGGNTDNQNALRITDSDATQILKELLPKAKYVYSPLFNGSGAFKDDPSSRIPKDTDYDMIVDTNINSVADVKKIVEEVFTKDFAEKEFYVPYLSETHKGSRPLYKEYNGHLYQVTRNGGRGWAIEWLPDTCKIKAYEKNAVVIEMDTMLFDKPDKKMNVRLENINGKWYIASTLAPL